ncbi:hypothetical protein P168DRAFT_291810 [Aspergillus campestris IBT 28561]|uniref:Uncharacterized protein n=1 Tax=Aspergillus campestris (strain IBT 28561) TaxID=1392248 RepID=A0A2I1CYG2_ASPC2|nr:uncharacterized protein P168DRAFT_291810 [Aspergillus campestris IBT 28561]PKY02670.1 hypothetical protein P168DRAFT_291810 [Aspergillus campestris IBT 28561]
MHAPWRMYPNCPGVVITGVSCRCVEGPVSDLSLSFPCPFDSLDVGGYPFVTDRPTPLAIFKQSTPYFVPSLFPSGRARAEQGNTHRPSRNRESGDKSTGFPRVMAMTDPSPRWQGTNRYCERGECVIGSRQQTSYREGRTNPLKAAYHPTSDSRIVP